MNFNELLDKQMDISAAILRDMQTGKFVKEHTLIEVFEANNKLVKQEEGSKYTRSTIDQYTTTLNRLKAFLKKEYKCNDMLLTKLDDIYRKAHFCNDRYFNKRGSYLKQFPKCLGIPP